MKKTILFIIVFLSTYVKGYSCAVCLGDFTKEEILAYSLSVVFMISVLVFSILYIYRKLKKHYDVE